MSGQTSATPIATIWKPSGARRVVIDGFLPVPRGGSVARAPLSWPAKDPTDILDYELDIAPALVGNEGDVISAVTLVIAPNGAGDLSAGNVAVDGSIAVVWLSNGVAGTTYVVQVTLATTSGRVLHRAILLSVQSLAAPAVPASALTTEAGAIISDQNGNPILIGS